MEWLIGWCITAHGLLEQSVLGLVDIWIGYYEFWFVSFGFLCVHIAEVLSGNITPFMFANWREYLH